MKVLVLQHSPVDHAGVLGELFRSDGAEVTTSRLDQGAVPAEVAGHDLLLVLGGPQDVWEEETYPWLVAEKALIREAVVHRRLPYLGICLGAQLLADALGGRVGPMAGPEIEVGEVLLTEAGRTDPLFEGIGPGYWSLHWHGAEVKQVSPGAAVLASSERCGVQAFRAAGCAYGIQCHMEFTPDTVRDWLRVPAYRHALVGHLGEPGAAVFEAESRRRAAAAEAVSRRLYSNFLKLMDRERR